MHDFTSLISMKLSNASTSSTVIAEEVNNFPETQALKMRPSPRLLASPVTAPLRPGRKSPPSALLPPIPLYRRLLRTHRTKLGPEQRIFGDTYLKAEFRRHKDIDNPLHIVGFLTKWQEYGQKLEGDDWKGDMLDKATVDKMSDQQIGQLYELMQAIQKRGRESADEELEGRIEN
jgi:Complex1_LYR-like